ncbi:hypothetical protein CHUAL_012003 [Chamberlinius hualienensis]
MPPGLNSQDPIAQMNTYRSFVSMLVDPIAKDENKLKAAQELSENFETIVTSPQYPSFLEHAMRIFLKILQDGDPHFLAEYNVQQLRKLILEILHRIPTNDHLRPYFRQILTLMFKLLEIENEENVLVCLRIIIELHKQFRPPFNPEIQHFLQFVKNVYKELPNHLNQIFEPRPSIKVKDLSEVNTDALLCETFTTTPILTEKKNQDGTTVSYNLIPKAVLSLKVLAELPIIVVLIYQLYKQNVHQEVAEFVPLILSTIMLQPSPQHRNNPVFNKEIFVDFMAAQIKTLSFLAYIVRVYQDIVLQYGNSLVKGMLGLLQLCPHEVAHLRKELLIAARHILATDLRSKFVSCIENLFDESILIGNGWTTYETLRPLAYSTLADLVHHVRQLLTINDLSTAVTLFSKNVHDDSLPTSIQTMSCKLLLNLVECIRGKSDHENGHGRELLMRMLRVFVLKFKIISKSHLPHFQKSRSTPSTSLGSQPLAQPALSTPNTLTPTPGVQMTPPQFSNAPSASVNPSTPGAQFGIDPKDDKLSGIGDYKDDKIKFGFPQSQAGSYTVADCRSLVKTLVCGVKTITWGIVNCKTQEGTVAVKPFQTKETLVFISLFKYALQALDIYMLSPTPFPPAGMRVSPLQAAKNKEEKEVLDHFAGVFNMMNPQTFKEIFSTMIEYMVERIHKNPALHIMCNAFLSNPIMSPIFATILIEFLLGRMEEMGANIEKSNLYLKLFKMVFGSVSMFPLDNEQMLKPHLHQIVNNSMEMAMSAKEPYNYYLLLRALFRSIGGGSHDQLYQEFLPLLPSLLQGLNSLQSGLHKQHMKDLFVELCLTVPVRLSSLLPYLPMLMDPLVSALNGSPTLVSQGLRTLELCVDNLQPDFLYEHIQPVRAELMQALWRTLHNSADANAQAAFRVLGKFGGGNRKMMTEPQKLEFNDKEGPGPCLTVHFQDYKTPIELPITKIIETAFNALKSSSTESFYRRQSWDVICCYLIASLKLDDEKHQMLQLFSHPSYTTGEILTIQGQFYKCPDFQARKVQEIALTSMFVAAAIKELRPTVLATMVFIVRHYTMLALSQQCGPFIANGKHGMDPLVLVDALTTIMGHEEKELCKPGHLALVLIMDTASFVFSSKERARQFPFLEYLVERLCSLCYERAWYAKVGGCLAIKFFIERLGVRWVLQHQFVFLKALLFVMMDLTGEVSNGAVDMAKGSLEKMLTLCAAPIPLTPENEDLIAVQAKSLHEVTQELVKQITSPVACVREQAIHSLKVLGHIQNVTVNTILMPHKDILAEMIPPKKHLLRHQPTNAQIGIMDGNTFCATLQPRLFSLDMLIPEHKAFFIEIFSMCDHDDIDLHKLPCFKSVTNLMPLRNSAFNALAACSYVPQSRDKIFTVLYKALNSSSSELQEIAFKCLKTMLVIAPVEMEVVHMAMRPLLLQLGDHRNLNLNFIQRLSYLTRLYPKTFNEKLCEQMLAHLRKWLEEVLKSQKGVQRTTSNEIKICQAIIDIFHQIPAASFKVVDPLTTLILRTEKALLIEAGSLFRNPLLKFLVRYPSTTMEFILNDSNIKDQHYNRFAMYLLRREDGKPFREYLQQNSNKFISMISEVKSGNSTSVQYNLVYLGISLVHEIVQADNLWLAEQHQLVAALRELWISTDYQERHKKVDLVEYSHWDEPKLLVKILLNYFEHHPAEIELLFQLLRPLNARFIPDFQFLKDFLEKSVADLFTIDWKRLAFFKFVDVFHDQSFPQDLKAKILRYIIIPCFANAFERGDGEKLIGGPPAPDQDPPENVISYFINKVIDPENPFGTSDAVRIVLLQLSCLLVEQASPHIHDAANKRQGNKLRRLMTFAWPCLLGKNCVDPATKYHGHLLLAHIIAKFAIHKRIVLQVFHSLLKAHALEARGVVKQALEILTPAMPVRMEDGNTMLTHWTKKIIIEEGHMAAQLMHMLQLLVRHHRVYYPVRHHLIQHMVNSMQRLGFTPTSTIEHKKLAVDLADIILKWEMQRIKEDLDLSNDNTEYCMPGSSVKRTSDGEAKRVRHLSSGVKTNYAEGMKPIEKMHSDAVVNFLLRIACQVNEQLNTGNSPGELLSRRCVSLLKLALKPEIWQTAELRLGWFDKLLMTVDTAQPNYSNICTALDLLVFLLSFLRKESILANFKPLQRGIAACMTCPNSKVIRATHTLLSKLMTIFPTEPSGGNMTSKYEELECLYACVGKVVHDGLANYEKNVNATPSNLFGTLMILKAACSNNLCFIDRLITSFMRVLQRMAKELINPTSQEGNPVASELLILSLDLVKNRVGVMGPDMRKTFIGTILVGLIEKTQDVKVMKAITKMVEEWVKQKNPVAVSQSPSPKEKSILLVKMMQFIEKRFPNDIEANRELNAQFLELVNFVYRDETLRNSELLPKLEQAFMAGLRCVQPHIRARFFEVYDASIKRRLHERLLYIICSQNWESIGPHYWIKQCIDLVLSTAVDGLPVQLSDASICVPSICSVIDEADSQDRARFAMVIKEESMDIESMESNKEEDELDIEMSTVPADETVLKDSTCSKKDSSKCVHILIARQFKFAASLREINTGRFLTAAAQLCHLDTKLAEWMWLYLFPKNWKILNEKEQQVISSEIVPFLCSGSHVIQKDCQPNAINTFMEALSTCTPAIPVTPAVLKYLGRSYNLWHRSALLLEQLVLDNALSSPLKIRPVDNYELEPIACPEQDRLDCLSDMYSLLQEEDMWIGLWQKRAKYKETCDAIACEQQGAFERAQGTYEIAMMKARQDYNTSPAPSTLQSEYKIWEQHWIRCCKELNQWDLLLEYGSSKGNPFLVLDSAWRVPNWGLMKDALVQVETNCPKDFVWKVNLYRGFVAICHSEENHFSMVERLVEVASTLCIKEWRRLPRIVSHIHLPFLQAAQQIIELQEAAQINQGLVSPNVGRPTSLQDMKAIVKTWRNRLPVVSDELSHWSDIFTWRQHTYQIIVNTYDSIGQQEQQSNHAMLGVHASAQAIIHFGKIARKHNLSGVCWDSLSRIHTIPSVPIVDCFQKIRQQVKCCFQMASNNGKNDLQEGLDVIESTNLKYFTKEMTAEFFALKGAFLAQIGRSEEANKSFSAAVQLHDTLVKAWALWGDYLEQVFSRDRNINVGISAIICFLHACRHQNENKCRKYLAKVLWLVTYDDEKGQLAEAIEKHSFGVPPSQWLQWIPQLCTCLVRNEGKQIMNLLIQIGKMYPQAVYFPVRTLYLTLKVEQRERFKASEILQQQNGDNRKNSTESVSAISGIPHQPTLQSAQFGSSCSISNAAMDDLAQQGHAQQQSQQTSGDSGPIKATTSMCRCSRIMHMQRDLHPTVLMSLEGIVDQMVWLRESWYEEVLRQLRQALTKCYAVAFENRAVVADSLVTPHTLSFVKKMVSTFGVGYENASSNVGPSLTSAASESLARRAQATAQDPVFHKMKSQFATDFDFNAPNAMKLHNLINKLRSWTKSLEAKIKTLPKSFLIEEKCRFLSNFSSHTAEIELPGEFLLPKHNHYYVKISRFMPRVEFVQKHNTAARRLNIRGHNGKIYPYLVVNDSCMTDLRREERILQLLRMLNTFLYKQKETARRFLGFTVPRVIAVAPTMRLVEDNPQSISLLDIYKQFCAKEGVDYELPIAKYYDRLATVQSRGSQTSHQVLRDILKEAQQSTMSQRDILKKWALLTFPGATDFWTFRKMFTLQLSLIGFVEFALHLTRLNPEMMYIHQDSGLINVSYFRFDIDDVAGDLDANRPVPFRLTPNIAEFLTTVGVVGPLTASMVATARCFVHPNFKVQALLRAILRDEFIAWHRKQEDAQQPACQSVEGDGELLIASVDKAVNTVTTRLQSLASFDGSESKWIAALQRKDKPGNDATVCSLHFSDGRPTLDKLSSTLDLGHNKKFEPESVC